MNFKKRLSKKTRIISLMILLVLVSATTIAFLQDYTGTITNKFSLKSVDTEIEEKVDTDLSKVPFVVNTDITDVMVRVRVVISGDFSKYGLAGIDDYYKNAENQWGDPEPAPYSNDKTYEEYWVLASTTINDKNDIKEYVFYYKKILYGTKQHTKNHATQPVFDKILLNTENGYKEYNEGNAEEFADLEKVQISIYQESVPLTVTTENGKVYKAVTNGDQISGFDDQNSDTYKIWYYFDNNQEL